MLFLFPSSILEFTIQILFFEMVLPGVRVHIWYPGPGCFNMAWCVRESLDSPFLEFRGFGRTAALMFRTADNHRLMCVGTHVAHGFEAQETLMELSAHCQRTSKGDSIAIVGNINIDFLPVSSQDPFAHLPNRQRRHQDRRNMLYTFLDSKPFSYK